MKKKKILLTLGIAAMMGLAGCGETPTDPQTPVDPPVVTVDPVITGISINAEGGATSVELGKTLKFTVEVSGEGDFNKQYTFSVDKEDIATISNEGVLTPKAEGSVRVTATAAGDTSMKASLDIAVNEVAKIEIKDVVKDKRQHVVGKITALTTRSFVVDDGTGAVLVFTKTAPEGYAIGDVVSVAGVVTEYHNNLQFPDTSVIKKTEGTIENTTIASPTAITAASYDEMAETLTALKPVSFWGTIFKEGDYLAVKVEDGSTHLIEPTDVPDSVSLVVGTAYNITGYLAPYYEKYSYSGLFITSATVKPIPVTAITVSAAGGATSVGLNETLQMSVTIAPEKATNKGVTWSVDKEDVASIDENGLLTGKTAGTVVVTATAKDGSGVSGTKSIEVLQFKDPVVSLTLGEAPSEIVLGDDDIDVTVTVAGESSTSNFNPAYTPTSSDDEVATVQATETGISIHPVAAGTVTITVKTAGTNADGEQLTKTIDLTVLGEPKVKTMTVAEASAWKPSDMSKDTTLKNRVISITGYATTEGNDDSTLYLVDDQGNAVQVYKAVSDGTYTYNTKSKEYAFSKGGTATDADHAALKGKQVTVKGFLGMHVTATTYSVQVASGIIAEVSDDAVVPTFVQDIRGQGTIDVDYTSETAYGATVNVSNVTPAEGYVLGSIILDNGTNVKKLSLDAEKYSFTAKGFNKIIVNFVKSSDLTAKTVSEVIARSEEADMDHKFGRNTYSEYFKMTGVLKEITNASNFIVADPADETKTIVVFDNGTLKTKYNSGEIGIGYEITAVGQLGFYSGKAQVTNIVESSCDAGEITGYTITKGTMEHGDIASIKIGENDVTGPVAPGTVVTVTLAPSDGYETVGLVATNSCVVTESKTNVFTVKVYGDTVLTASFSPIITNWAHTQDFENQDFKAGTTYNNNTEVQFGPDAAKWGTICGTVTTTNKIEGTKSMGLRYYKSVGVAPQAYMLYDVTGTLSHFRFQYSGAEINMAFVVSYSTDSGAHWTDLPKRTVTTANSAEWFQKTLSESVSKLRIKVTLTDHPNEKKQLTLDTFKFA